MNEMFVIVKREAEKLCPGCECIIGGSYRRGALDSGDIDLLIYPPVSTPAIPPGISSPTSSSSSPGNYSKRLCRENDSEFTGSTSSYRYIYLPDLLRALEDIGFLTHHLSYPHISTPSHDLVEMGRGESDEEVEQGEIEEGTARDHMKYLGICKLPHSNIHRRIDIWVRIACVYT